MASTALKFGGEHHLAFASRLILMIRDEMVRCACMLLFSTLQYSSSSSSSLTFSFVLICACVLVCLYVFISMKSPTTWLWCVYIRNRRLYDGVCSTHACVSMNFYFYTPWSRSKWIQILNHLRQYDHCFLLLVIVIIFQTHNCIFL